MAENNISEQLDILEETKLQIKQAIINKGQPVSDSDSFRSYVQKIEDISTMNAQSKIVIPTTLQQIITPDSNYNALSQVTVEAVDNNIDANILSENIRNGVTILGVTGTVEEGIDTSDATALDDDIAVGKTAYVNGQKITGTIPYTSTFNPNTDHVMIEYNIDDDTVLVSGGLMDTDDGKHLVDYSSGIEYVLPKQRVLDGIPALEEITMSEESGSILYNDSTNSLTFGNSLFDNGDATKYVVQDQTTYATVTYPVSRVLETIPASGEIVLSQEQSSVIMPSYENNKFTFSVPLGLEAEEKLVAGNDTYVTFGINEDRIADALGAVLLPENIKAGVTILGITGTYEGDYSDTLTPEEYNEAVETTEDILDSEEPEPTEIQTYYEIEYD